jgi:hypothetical protein
MAVKIPGPLEEAPHCHRYGNQREDPFDVRTSQSRSLIGQRNQIQFEHFTSHFPRSIFPLEVQEKGIGCPKDILHSTSFHKIIADNFSINAHLLSHDARRFD